MSRPKYTIEHYTIIAVFKYTIDYAKACDCVSKLWDTMEQIGFPVPIIQLVANMYKEQESVVRTTKGDTDWFKIERVVRARLRDITKAVGLQHLF